MIDFLRISKRPAQKAPPPESYIDLMYDTEDGVLVFYTADGAKHGLGGTSGILRSEILPYPEFRAITAEDSGTLFIADTDATITLPDATTMLGTRIAVLATEGNVLEFGGDVNIFATGDLIVNMGPNDGLCFIEATPQGWLWQPERPNLNLLLDTIGVPLKANLTIANTDLPADTIFYNQETGTLAITTS